MSKRIWALLNLPPFFYLYFYRQTLKTKIYSRQRQKRKKDQKNILLFLGHFIWAQNGHLENDPRAYVLAKVGAVKCKKERIDKKRDRDTERARDGPKRHANYGPSLSVSIPSNGESVVSLNCAKMAHEKRAVAHGFRRLELWVAAQDGHIGCKVGPEESGAHFYCICATHILYALRRQRHLKGVLRFFWSALYGDNT